MSLKNLAYFFCGVIVTGITFIAWNYIDRSHVSISEEALGGMFYEELAKYPAECDVDKITLVMRDISYGKRKKMSRQDREEILFELASRESEEIASVWQAIYTAGVVIPSPVTTTTYYHRALNPKKLIEVGFSSLPVGEPMARYLKRVKLPTEKQLNIIGDIRPME